MRQHDLDTAQTPKGVFTSEFWLVILVLVFTFVLIFTGKLPSEAWGELVIGQGIAVGVYAVSRAYAKK